MAKKTEIKTYLYPRTKISQYFEKDPQIHIEKIRKAWIGDPRQLEEDLKVIRAKIFFVENQNDNLNKRVSELEKERDALKISEASWKNKTTEAIANSARKEITHSNTITRLAQELSNARRYEKFIRKDTDELERVCQNLQGSLKNWTTNKIRNWLKEINPYFKQIYLLETYDLVNEGFHSWIRSLEKIDNLEKDVASWKVTYGLTRDKIKEQDQKLVDKDDQLIRLNKQLGAFGIILDKQYNHIDKLTKNLEVLRDKVLSSVSTSEELKEHLQTDILDLAKQRKELIQNLKDLREEEKKNKTLRDKEIANLRNEKQQVENNLVQEQNKSKQLENFRILSCESALKINELEKELSATRTEQAQQIQTKDTIIEDLAEKERELQTLKEGLNDIYENSFSSFSPREKNLPGLKEKIKKEAERVLQFWRQIDYEGGYKDQIDQKDARIYILTEKIDKAVELLKWQTANIEEKEATIEELEIELKNTHPQDAHVYSFLEHLREDLKAEQENKKVINQRIEELEKQTAEDKLVRDNEIEGLKGEMKRLGGREKNIVRSFEELRTHLIRTDSLFSSFEDKKIEDMTETELKDIINKMVPPPSVWINFTDKYTILKSILTEYKKEKFWWDKWIDKEEKGLFEEVGNFLFEELPEEIKKARNKKYSIREISSHPPREFKQNIKYLYMHYRNR